MSLICIFVYIKDLDGKSGTLGKYKSNQLDIILTRNFLMILNKKQQKLQIEAQLSELDVLKDDVSRGVLFHRNSTPSFTFID